MNIQSVAAVENLSVGGRLFYNLAALKILTTITTGAATGNSTFVDGVGSAYTPSGIKTFQVCAVKMIVLVANASRFSFGYADNNVGQASNTAFTNGVSFWDGLNIVAINVGQEYYYYFGSNCIVPNGKYPFVTTSGNDVRASYQMFGYEI